MPAAIQLDNKTYGAPEHILQPGKSHKPTKYQKAFIDHFGGAPLQPARYQDWAQAELRPENSREMTRQEKKHWKVDGGPPPEYVYDTNIEGKIPITTYGLGGDGGIFKHIPIDAGSAIGFDSKYNDDFGLQKERFLSHLIRSLRG